MCLTSHTHIFGDRFAASTRARCARTAPVKGDTYACTSSPSRPKRKPDAKSYTKSRSSSNHVSWQVASHPISTRCSKCSSPLERHHRPHTTISRPAAGSKPPRMQPVANMRRRRASTHPHTKARQTVPTTHLTQSRSASAGPAHAVPGTSCGLRDLEDDDAVPVRLRLRRPLRAGRALWLTENARRTEACRGADSEYT